MKNNTRKILLAVLVVLTLLVSMTAITVSAADGNTVYLDPEDWDTGSARFAIYTWDGGDQWFDMTDGDGDGIYECTLPTGISNIIFVSFPKTSSDYNWDNRNSQTSDLTLHAGDTYIIDTPGGTGNNKATGHWKSGATDGGNSGTTTPDGSTTYTVAGVEALCGSEWNTGDTYNDMTLNPETGLYEKTFKGIPAGYYECKVVENHSWDNQSWGGTAGEYGTNYGFETDAEYNITITFNATTFEVSHVLSESTGPEERPVLPGTDFESCDKITIYVGDSANWGTVFVHAWIEKGTNDEPYKAWPGLEMEWDGDKLLYYIELPSVCDSVLFHDGNGTQTDDLMIPKDGANLYDNTSGTWVDIKNYTPPAPPEDTTESVTVYVKDTAGWGAVYIHFWNASGDLTNETFPGSPMEKGEDGYYYATIPAGYYGVVFSNGGDWQDGSLLQTSDLTIPKDGKNHISNTATSDADWYSVGGGNQGGNTPGDDQPAKEMTFLQKLALKLLLFLRSIEDMFKNIFKK